MAYSFLLRIWALIPKWLLVGLVAYFFAYYMGVSHGREPYKLAAKAKVIGKNANEKHLKIDEKGIIANESTQNYDWVFDINATRKLSDILSQ
uniref:Uncharacterized protein n=1 Tax=OCS116 cluster bacterium TaxID=2030921 RepID=A0A2A4Z125_9PROT